MNEMFYCLRGYITRSQITRLKLFEMGKKADKAVIKGSIYGNFQDGGKGKVRSYQNKEPVWEDKDQFYTPKVRSLSG